MASFLSTHAKGLVGSDAGSTNSDPEPDSKRRKIRKGTTSCWDCKKRKVKCTFDETSETICISCRRRGAPCLRQDLPEHEAQAHTKSNHDALLDRMHKLESMLENLIDVKPAHVEQPAAQSFKTPTSKQTDHPPSGTFELDVTRNPFQPLPPPTTAAPDVSLRMIDDSTKLSQELVKAFPSQADIDILCKSDYVATFYCHQMFTKYGPPEHQAFEFVNSIAKVPDPLTTPPVLIAKRMLIFASFLYHFYPQNNHGLSEHPATILDRLFETAVRLVTTNENVVCGIDGLECIILEGVFQSHSGNLRRAWLAFRKAMVVAQLLRLDLPNPPLIDSAEGYCKVNPKFLWFRIVYMDSYLSLMLGLPHGAQDTNMEHDIPGETPTCKLERAHTLIARRIIDRNRRGASPDDIAVTRALDQELLEASRVLSDEFWAQPDYSKLHYNSPEAFSDIMRLAEHLHHYNLVHLLHLPYLLRDDKESSYYAYSKTTCVHASRELLYRVIPFHHFNENMVALPCRTADFFALMAGMTILLAHIDGNRMQTKDWRAHQRRSDRAIVQQLLDILELESNRTQNSLTIGMAKTLHCLLDIESDTARGMGTTADDTVSRIAEHWSELRVSIPYLGIIKIGREGITKDWPTMLKSSQSSQHEATQSVHAANHILSTVRLADTLQHCQQSAASQLVPDMRSTPLLPVSSIDANVGTFIDTGRQDHPGLMASIDDWAFQGVDGAFFESMLRGSTDWDATLQANNI